MAETDDKGNKQRTTRNKDEGRGTPQGAPLSPLLANLYMRRFILAWKKFGYAKLFHAAIVNYKVEQLNEVIRGWANYFRLGSVSAAYQAVMLHACRRLRQWLGCKNGTRVGLSRCSDKYLHATLGLIDPTQVRKAYRLSCATV